MRFVVRYVPEHNLRQPHHKLAKPGILFEQRHNVVVRTIVIEKIVTFN